ncbi:unnamed protein product [Cylindrotheca closterium]|uniref:Bromo domain-containing protein n=1 Tax=Cylindrotheca closterium TaxID=2856 RepID=A0AAD2FIW4_9STRA|nr:unnamed protein product [Cylindrotheca closterium]
MMSSNPGTPATPETFASPGGKTTGSSAGEDELRKQLRAALQSLNRREPLEPSYKRLLLNGTVTRRLPTIPKDKFYKRIGSGLRQRVERYMVEMQGKDPFDRISQRQPLEEEKMRAAFTLRETKAHEQQPLLEATLAQTMMHPERKRALDGIAMGLQSRNAAPKKIRTSTGAPISAMEQTEKARRKAELDRQREQARKWEEARSKREEEERLRREREVQQRKPAATPQQTLILKVFNTMWDMNFKILGDTNPFRTVIDRNNCAAIGAPDYFDIITTPMNLTYIKDKVHGMKYITLQSFFADIDLMIQNALTYNSAAGNPYRVAAEEMNKRYQKIVKKIWQQKKRQQAAMNES